MRSVIIASRSRNNEEYDARRRYICIYLQIVYYGSHTAVIHNEMWSEHNFQLTEKHEVERDKSFNIYKVLDSLPRSNYDLQIEVPR